MGYLALLLIEYINYMLETPKVVPKLFKCLCVIYLTGKFPKLAHKWKHANLNLESILGT